MYLPQIIAHRGASFDAPENTLAAINLAWRQQADAVEIDIRLTQDEHIVAIHDADTTRTCDRQMIVAESTYAELQQADAGGWKGPAYRGEQIPQLAEILSTLPESACLFIEIKCGEEILAPLAAQLAGDVKLQSRLVLIGFNAALIAKTKTILPASSALLCAAVGDRDAAPWSAAAIEKLVEKAKCLKLDGVDLDAAAAIDRRAVERLHDAGLGCYFWTVDNPPLALQLTQCGVDGVTTNRPGWLREKLETGGSHTSSHDP